MKLAALVYALMLFTCLLTGIYFIHVRHFTVDVVLYDAIGDVIMTLPIFALLLWRIRIFNVFTGFERFQIVTITLLLGSLLAILLPTIIDRSLSFYLLEKLQQHGGAIRRDRFDDVVAKDYLKEHRLVDIRLTEQVASGTIVIQKGCVQLTDRGRRLATFSRAFRKNLLPRQRLIDDRYTDALTDPFRGSTPANDYRCD